MFLANGVLNQLGLRSGYAKALVAVLLAFIGALVTATSVGDQSLGDLSTKDWVLAAGAAIASGGMVWLVGNIDGVAGGIAKAVSAAATAGIASYLLATGADSAGGEAITSSEWLGIFSVAIVATGFVYQEKNDPE